MSELYMQDIKKQINSKVGPKYDKAGLLITPPDQHISLLGRYAEAQASIQQAWLD
jgi:hypothetical protein